MKTGELIILWVGGLCSVFVLIVSSPPTETLSLEPIIASYFINIIRSLLAIWILCGLVWVTLYRRQPKKAFQQSSDAAEQAGLR